jgi:hypothetical protein
VSVKIYPVLPLLQIFTKDTKNSNSTDGKQLGPEGFESGPSQIRRSLRMSLFSPLQIFTDLRTKELSIDIVCEDNKTRNRRPCCPHLHLTRRQCCSLHPAFHIAPRHVHGAPNPTPSSLASNVDKVSSTDSIYSN